MKTALLLLFVVVASAGCQPLPQAPATNRMASAVLLDEHYLKDVFIPSYGDASSRSALSNSVSQLDANLVEFRAFMHQVEVGKIPITQDFKGGWHSTVTQDDAWTAAGYSGSLGPVIDFQKHKNQDPFPLIYSFSLYTNGYLHSADTQEWALVFNEQGKVTYYWHK
jgi:hypothetical protein